MDSFYFHNDITLFTDLEITNVRVLEPLQWHDLQAVLSKLVRVVLRCMKCFKYATDTSVTSQLFLLSSSVPICDPSLCHFMFH
jgi:hypothetical protein